MKRFLYFLIAACVVGADQLTKNLASVYLRSGTEVPLIKGVFSLIYTENRGVAFSLFQDGGWFFIPLSTIVAMVVIWAILRMDARKTWLMLGLSFVLGGAAGNLMDRVFAGYVVDFFYFKLINFPVFNTADSFVVAGAVMLGIWFVFMDKKKEAL